MAAERNPAGVVATVPANEANQKHAVHPADADPPALPTPTGSDGGKTPAESGNGGGGSAREEHLLPPEKNPRNWPRWKKWCFVALLTFFESTVLFVSLVVAASIPEILDTFPSSRPRETVQMLGSFVVSAFVLGLAFAPILIGPLSDLYGRMVVMRTSMVGFTAFMLACGAAPSLESLIALRFLAGCFGGAPMTIGGAVIADMYEEGDRRTSMLVYNTGEGLVPMLAPLIGGQITHAIGWRWSVWIVGIAMAIATVLLFFVDESHHPTLVARHLSAQARAAGKAPPGRLRAREILVRAGRAVGTSFALIIRIAFTHPATGAMCAVVLVVVGLLDIFFSSLGTVGQVHFGWTSQGGGYLYVPLSLGCLLGLAMQTHLNNWFVRAAKKLRAQHRRRRGGDENMENAEAEPAAGNAKGTAMDELLFLAFSIPGMAAGMIWYGWGLESGMHWIMAMAGLFVYGFAYIIVRPATQLYFIEAVPGYAGSALGAHTVFTCIGGATIPLATWPTYNRIGYGWGNTLFGLVNMVVWGIIVGLVVAKLILKDKFDLYLRMRPVKKEDLGAAGPALLEKKMNGSG